jgi:SAM-dependent methyltransferase
VVFWDKWVIVPSQNGSAARAGTQAKVQATPSGFVPHCGDSYDHVRLMDDGLRDRMLAYYQRASEYEEAYTRGTGTASITDSAVFTTEIAVLKGIVRGFGRGHLLDMACGTGYWLPHYIGNCSRVTLFDQSEQMLAECELKVRRLSGPSRCSLVRGDVFDYEFPPFAHEDPAGWERTPTACHTADPVARHTHDSHSAPANGAGCAHSSPESPPRGTSAARR